MAAIWRGGGELLKPQWSPPLIGGAREVLRQEVTDLGVPQWSPPLIGGASGHAAGGELGGVVASMEPAVDRRGEYADPKNGKYPIDTPQWSPPLIGGASSPSV